MLLILFGISFQSFALFCFAFVDLQRKIWKDRSNSAFIQVPYINTVRNNQLLRAQKDISQSWPKGVVRYRLDNQTYDSFINSSLQAAMRLIESESCIKFEEEFLKPTDNKTWIHFTNPHKERACVHQPQFMQSGEIVVTLGYDCLKPRDILHALLHGIGFKDEVTHPHRDNYITVLWNNIDPGYRNLFIKESTDSARSSVEYDPFSIMHFHERAYSINGKATIIPLEPGLVIHPSDSLSQLDRMRLHMYFGYECNRRNVKKLLDSCKMTLQRKDDSDKKNDKDEDRQEKEKPKEEEGDDKVLHGPDDGSGIDDKGDKNKNKTQNNDENDDLGENRDADTEIKENKQKTDENHGSGDDKQVDDKDMNNKQTNDADNDLGENRNADTGNLVKKQDTFENDNSGEDKDGDDGDVNIKVNNDKDGGDTDITGKQNSDEVDEGDADDENGNEKQYKSIDESYIDKDFNKDVSSG